jgi:hypothetical protein
MTLLSALLSLSQRPLFGDGQVTYLGVVLSGGEGSAPRWRRHAAPWCGDLSLRELDACRKIAGATACTLQDRPSALSRWGSQYRRLPRAP